MSETERDMRHTRRAVAGMGVALTSAAAAAFVATSGALAGQGNNQGGNNQGGNNNNQGQNGDGGSPRGAPAPAIGTGLSALLAIAGVLLGAKLLRRKRVADSQ